MALCAMALALHAQPAPADIVIVNARIFTGVNDAPWAEAIAIRADRIVDVGTSDAVRKQAGSATRVIDAGGRLVVPGINDAHAHPGAAPAYTPLGGPPAFEQDPTLDEVLERIKRAAATAPAGGWLVGEIGARVLDDPRATREVLDPITGDRPVLLGSWHGHGTPAQYSGTAAPEGRRPGSGSARRILRSHDGWTNDHRTRARVRRLHRPQTLPSAGRSRGADQSLSRLCQRGGLVRDHIRSGHVHGRRRDRCGRLDRGRQGPDPRAAHRFSDDRNARVEGACAQTNEWSADSVGDQVDP